MDEKRLLLERANPGQASNTIMKIQTEFKLASPTSPLHKRASDVISSSSSISCDGGEANALPLQQQQPPLQRRDNEYDDDDDDDDDCSDDSSFYDDSSDDESCSEEESSMVKQLVSASFANGLMSSSMLARMLRQPPAKKARHSSEGTMFLGAAPRKGSLPPTSTTAMSAFVPAAAGANNKMTSVPSSACLREHVRLSQSAPCLVIKQRTSAQDPSRSTGNECCSPDEFLRTLLKRGGHFCHTVPASELSEFFHKNNLSEEAVASYDMPLIQAIRNDDIDALRRLLEEEDRTLQCCNKFGESIVHTVSRRGSVDVLKFMVEEANVSVRVCCDSGRTPLHDACWSSQPRFGIVSMLLDQCPDLLYVTDKRGFTPLAYVPRDNWKDWCRFLECRGADWLVAKELS